MPARPSEPQWQLGFSAVRGRKDLGILSQLTRQDQGAPITHLTERPTRFDRLTAWTTAVALLFASMVFVASRIGKPERPFGSETLAFKNCHLAKPIVFATNVVVAKAAPSSASDRTFHFCTLTGTVRRYHEIAARTWVKNTLRHVAVRRSAPSLVGIVELRL